MIMALPMKSSASLVAAVLTLFMMTLLFKEAPLLFVVASSSPGPHNDQHAPTPPLKRSNTHSFVEAATLRGVGAAYSSPGPHNDQSAPTPPSPPHKSSNAHSFVEAAASRGCLSLLQSLPTCPTPSQCNIHVPTPPGCCTHQQASEDSTQLPVEK